MSITKMIEVMKARGEVKKELRLRRDEAELQDQLESAVRQGSQQKVRDVLDKLNKDLNIEEELLKRRLKEIALKRARDKNKFQRLAA